LDQAGDPAAASGLPVTGRLERKDAYTVVSTRARLDGTSVDVVHGDVNT